jgi:FAD-dependent oxidoreductase domain-containing protein 1
MSSRNYDIIIIGGGVMGSSIAYHLLNDGFDGTVAILEKDPTYEHASTALSAGGIRQQFSTKVNIEIGLYGVGKIERFDEEMAVEGEPAHAEYRSVGYLFLADENNWSALKKQNQIQRSLGVEAEILTPGDLKKLIPHLDTESLRGASFCKRAGYTDPYGILQGYLKKARSLGARYRHEEVTGIIRHEDRVYGVQTSRGERIEGAAVVIAAGPWAAQVGAMAGIILPVEPSPKMVFQFSSAEVIGYDFPFLFSPKGHWCRPETGGQFIAGKDHEEPPGFRFDWNRAYFEETVWPELARLVPSFDRLKLMGGWTGLYAVNRLDFNALLGTYPGLEGLYMTVGFSGHGLMQAPAVGKGISELIRTGGYKTVDLTPLGVDRILTGRRVIEEAVF